MYLNFWSINDIVITLANTNSDNNTVQTNKIIRSNDIFLCNNKVYYTKNRIYTC